MGRPGEPSVKTEVPRKDPVYPGAGTKPVAPTPAPAKPSPKPSK